MPEIVTTWFGAFLFEGDRQVRAYLAPVERDALANRMRLRLSGALTPEEQQLLAEHATERLVSRDRRFSGGTVRLGGGKPRWVDPAESGFDPAWHRLLILEAAEELLRKSWDPSVLVEQAVRAIEELTSTENLLSERLEEWEARRAPPTPEQGPESLGEPEVEAAREQLEALREQARATRGALEGAVERSMPHRAPNLVRLLGPLLTARLLSLAGGLQRLARLPASTVQVLGAERAFFEHLRGRAPPPRHGLLFLHPSIQGAPRSRRGPLARALAGKVSIAARLDAAGSAIRPELLEGFEARVREIESRPLRRKSKAGRRSA